MIRYHRLSWWGQLTATRGGVVPEIFRGAVFYLCYLVALYGLCLQAESDVIIADDQHTFHYIGHIMMFMLVFRLNQCWNRYCDGNDLTAAYFNGLHSLQSMCLAYLKGSQIGSLNLLDRNCKTTKQWLANRDKMLTHDGLAITVRVHIMRLTLAMAVALKYHCRITESAVSGSMLDPDTVTYVLFDFIRIRGLLYPSEQPILAGACGLYSQRATDGAECCGKGEQTHNHWYTNLLKIPLSVDYWNGEGNLGFNSASCVLPPPRPVFLETDLGPELSPDYVGVPLPLVLLQLLRFYIREPLLAPWGYAERMVNLAEIHISTVCMSFESLDRLITTPLPLAYLQHCKVLFLSFSALYPLTLQTSHGAWANIVAPFLIFIALFGIECLAEHFENPIGEDVADLNVVEMIHDFEVRSHEVFNLACKHRQDLRSVTMRPLQGLGLCEDELEWHSSERDEVWKNYSSKLESTSSKGGCVPTDFFAYFSWVPMPPHVFWYSLEMDNRLDVFRLRSIRKGALKGVLARLSQHSRFSPPQGGSKGPAVAAAAAAAEEGHAAPAGPHKQAAWLNAFQEERSKSGASMTAPSNFVCLKENKEHMMTSMDQLAHDYFDQHADPRALDDLGRSFTFHSEDRSQSDLSARTPSRDEFELRVEQDSYLPKDRPRAKTADAGTSTGIMSKISSAGRSW